METLMLTEAEFQAHFDALNEHLAEVRPIFDQFCRRHGFVYVDRTAIGRYPRIRVVRGSAPNVWFDLMMEPTPDGNRREIFTRDATYELGAGASLDIENFPNRGTRYAISYLCFRSKPFDQLPSILEHQLELNLKILQGWDAEYILKNGKSGKFG